MDMIPVTSSNVAAIGYAAAEEQLHVKFTSGAVYIYKAVPVETFNSLREAPSVGSYLNKYIKPNHMFIKVSE